MGLGGKNDQEIEEYLERYKHVMYSVEISHRANRWDREKFRVEDIHYQVLERAEQMLVSLELRLGILGTFLWGFGDLFG